MKYAIQFTDPEELKALPILLRQFSGRVLSDKRYILEEKAILALRKAGIVFTELGKMEPDAENR